MNMKKITALGLAAVLGVSLFGCGKKEAVLPEKHPIGYPENYATNQDNEGADSYGGVLDTQSRYFTANDYYNMTSHDTLHILPKFETYQQSTEYTCGNASALMVLNHFGVKDYDEMQLADIMEGNPEVGTTVEHIADFFENLGWNVDVHADTELKFEDEEDFYSFVIEKIDAGIPIMVDWVDWGGHWQVIIGIDTCNPDYPDDNVLILADPYDITDHYQDGYYIFPACRFMTLWREGPVCGKDAPYEQPYVCAWPKR